MNVKLNKKYSKLEVKYTNKFHDRFLILDRKYIYHIGASIKDLGKKCFGINEIENRDEIDKLINEVINNCRIDN